MTISSPRSLIGYFVDHPTAANLGVIAIVIGGLLSLMGMERESFPETDSTQINVSVSYPGAAPDDVDEAVCRALDDAFIGLTHLESQFCVSTTGSASASLTMADEGDINQFFNDVSSAVGRADLPAEADSPTITLASRTDLIAIIGVNGLPTSQDLDAYSHELARRLREISGVATVGLGGLSDSLLKISYDQRALRLYGLSARQVSDILASRSLQRPIGELDTETESFYLRYDDVRRSVDELSRLVVAENANGGQIKLGDIAKIDFTEESPEERTEIDGKRAVTLRISKNRQDDAIRVFDRVLDFIAEERDRFPEPFNIFVYRDLTSFIQDRIRTVTSNMVQGLALVAVVMMLFFSLREAFWISFTLPVSLLGGIILMYLLGISINMISLVGLLISVGLIMDDSIVISDNISRHRRLSKSSRDAAIDGTKEVISGIVSSFLTTAAVFTPLMFIEGNIGKILGLIPMVLLVTLSLSLLEAFLMLPNHLSHVKRGATRNLPASVLFEKLKNGAVLPVVRVLTRWRYLTIGTVLGIFIISIAMVVTGKVSAVFFPRTEGDNVEVRVSLIPGTTLEESRRVAETIAAALGRAEQGLAKEVPTGEKLVQRVIVSFADNPDVRDQGPHTFTVEAQLLSAERRGVKVSQILNAWKAEVPPITDLLLINYSRGGFGAGGADIDLEVYGSNKDDLLKAADDLVDALAKQPGVVSVFNNFSQGAREIRLKLLPDAYTYGLTPQSLSDQLRSAIEGISFDRFSIGDRTIDIKVGLGDKLGSLEDMKSFPILVKDGRAVSLRSVADFSIERTFPQVSRKDGRIFAGITGELDYRVSDIRTLNTAIARISDDLEKQYHDIEIKSGSAVADRAKTSRSIFIAFALGLLGVYIILSFQFRSYILPLVVMIAIPFSLIGVIWGHFLMGVDLAMPSAIGFASLAGIVVNNAILFMIFFDSHRQQDGYEKAAVEAVNYRFRPVFLSSMTTFIGLLPILFETSLQAQVLIPLVISVALGMLTSSALIVFVFPSVLCIYYDCLLGLQRLWQWLKRLIARPEKA